MACTLCGEGGPKNGLSMLESRNRIDFTKCDIIELHWINKLSSFSVSLHVCLSLFLLYIYHLSTASQPQMRFTDLQIYRFTDFQRLLGLCKRKRDIHRVSEMARTPPVPVGE